MPAATALRVTIVDDQKSMRTLVRGSLQTLGVKHVVECEDGADALRSLDLHPAHLIISDLNMPVLDGLGLLEAVRKKPGCERLAFIMLTNRGEVDLVKRAVALGVNNYLMKPFTIAALKQKIESVFGALT